MITSSHIIYSWALAKKTEAGLNPKRTFAFITGALFPDIPTYLFFLVCGVLLGYSGQEMWGDMYFNSGWAIPITLTHSFIIWPFLMSMATFFGWKFLQYFSLSALLHTAVDFCVHTDDAYRHFWPLSNWKFHSPISYYNSAEYGQYVGAFDSLLVLGLLFFLYYKYTGKWRLVICVLGAVYLFRLIIEPILLTNMHHGS